MTPEQIAAWAKEADQEFGNEDNDMPDALCGMAAITRFAALVAAHERERWAQFVEAANSVVGGTARMELAAAIRAQGREPCGACNGSGWVVRDPDIGTDQECFVCNGSGKFSEAI